MKFKTKPVFATIVAMSIAVPAFAIGDDAELRELKRQVETLQARVAALEAHFTFASFMPDYAERFHVMHRAGESGDWAVASHELQELRRLTRVSPSIDAEMGTLMIGMMETSLSELEAAIEHSNYEKFAKALTQTIETCNACHKAAGSGFVQVTLDATDSLNMRHPHALMPRTMPSGHTHKHGTSPAGSTMMMDMSSGDVMQEGESQ